MTPAPTLQDLIGAVQHDAADAHPLTRLATAAGMMQEVNEVADAALGYFVDQARRAGHSWAEIGESIGVSKQAAQQRHNARISGRQSTVTFERFTGRARNVVTHADTVARELGHTWIGTEHLLLALYSEPEGVAAQVLAESGLQADTARRLVRSKVGDGPGASEGELPFTPRAYEVFAGALTVALELGHNYIGTEHLLLGMFRSEAVAAAVLREAGLDEAAVRTRVTEKLAGYRAVAEKPVRKRGAKKT